MELEGRVAVPSTEAGVDQAIAWVRARIVRAGLDEGDGPGIELALRAALLDAHVAANHRDPSEAIELVYHREVEAVEFSLTPSGRGPGASGRWREGRLPFFDEFAWDGRRLRVRKSARPWTPEIVAGLWRSLGFHGARDLGAAVWRVSASCSGFDRLAELLRAHASAADPRSTAGTGYGPYAAFVVFSWLEPVIDATGIGGRPDDLVRLADLVRRRGRASRPGELVALAPEWAPGSPFGLDLAAREDSFDPASLDVDP